MTHHRHTLSRLARPIALVIAALVALTATATATAQTEYVYGDLKCALGPGQCALVDFAGGGGGGLTQAQVDARVRAGVKDFARAGGAGINHSDFDSATETELRDSVPYDGPAFAWPNLTFTAHDGSSSNVEIRDRTAQRNDARLDAAEAFEGVLRSRTNLRAAHRVEIDTTNVAYALGTRLPLTGADFELVVVVTATGEPDGHLTTTRDALVAAGSVTRANAPLTSSNGLEFVNTPDNNRLRLGIDTNGNLYGGSDTADTTFWTLDRFDIDATPTLQFGSGGDVAFTRDATHDLVGELRPGVVDVAALRFDSGTAVAGRYVTINAGATGFAGAGAGDITGVTAGDGLTGGGTSGDVTLTGQARNGVEIVQDHFQLHIDPNSNTLDQSVAGAKVADKSIGPAQITAQSITADELANNAVQASELADNAVDTAAISDGQVTEPKLGSGVQAKLHTEREIEGIAAREEASRFIDAVAEWDAQTEGQIETKTFQIGGVTWEFDDVAPGRSGGFAMTLGFPGQGTITQAQLDALERYHMRFGDRAVAIADGGCTLVELNRDVDCQWAGVTGLTFPLDFVVGEPLDDENYVPETDTAGQLCLSEADAHCEWRAAAATADRAGLVELATTDEADAGTDTTRAVTPAGVHSAIAAQVPAHVPAIQRVTFLDRQLVIADPTRKARSPFVRTRNPTNLDLDAALYARGSVQLEASVVMQRADAAGIGFEAGGNNPNRTVGVNAFHFVSTIKGTGAYSGNTTDAASTRGLVVGTATVYFGSTTLGELTLYVGRNGDNELGYYLDYDGQGGSASGNGFTVQASVEAIFMRQDTDLASAVTGLQLNMRGPRAAYTNALPTNLSNQAVGTAIGSPLQWSFGNPRIRGWFKGAGSVLRRALNVRPAGTLGIWIVSRVGSDERHQMFWPWGPVGVGDPDSHNEVYSEGRLYFGGSDVNRDSSSASFIKVRWIIGPRGHSQIKLYAAGKDVPANSSVHVYDATPSLVAAN